MLHGIYKTYIDWTGWYYACAGAWPLSGKDVIAENKMVPLLQYFVLMAIIVSIECRKDVFKWSVCGKNPSNLKAERRKFRVVSDDLFACFGPHEEESPHEPGKKFLCGTCRRALADFKRTGKTFFSRKFKRHFATKCNNLCKLSKAVLLF